MLMPTAEKAIPGVVFVAKGQEHVTCARIADECERDLT